MRGRLFSNFFSPLPSSEMRIFDDSSSTLSSVDNFFRVPTGLTLAGRQQEVSQVVEQASERPMAIFPNRRKKREVHGSRRALPSIFSAVKRSTSREVAEEVDAAEGHDSSSRTSESVILCAGKFALRKAKRTSRLLRLSPSKRKNPFV